jgi:rubredoxin
VKAYICTVCEYLYDVQTAKKNTEGNLIPFEELDSEWRCPNCGVRPDLFIPTESDRTPDLQSKQPKTYVRKNVRKK